MDISSRNSLYGKFRDTFLNCSKFSCSIAVVNNKKKSSVLKFMHPPTDARRLQRGTLQVLPFITLVGKRKGFQDFIVKFSTTRQHFDSF